MPALHPEARDAAGPGVVPKPTGYQTPWPCTPPLRPNSGTGYGHAGGQSGARYVRSVGRRPSAAVHTASLWFTRRQPSRS